jgi:hypothetical protein
MLLGRSTHVSCSIGNITTPLDLDVRGKLVVRVLVLNRCAYTSHSDDCSTRAGFAPCLTLLSGFTLTSEATSVLTDHCSRSYEAMNVTTLG